MDTIVSGKSNQLQHDFRAQIQSKLNNIVSEEAGLTADVQSSLVAAATERVTAQVSSDAAKKVALEQAIAAIANPDASTGKDQVSDLYASVFADFAKSLAAAKEKEQTLSAQVQPPLRKILLQWQGEMGLTSSPPRRLRRSPSGRCKTWIGRKNTF